MQLDELILDFVDSAQASYERPVIVYDLRRIRERIAQLSSRSRKENVKFLFAYKSFPFSDVAKVTARSEAGLDGFDVSNAQEWSQVAPYVRANSIVSIVGPAWHVQEFNPSVETVIWNASTPTQLTLAKQRTETATGGGLIGIRLRIEEPPNKANEEKRSRFGFASIREALSTGIVSAEEIAAVHVHRGWDTNDLGSCRSTLERIVGEIAEMAVPVRFINLGGGLHRLGLEGIDELIAHARAIVPDHVTLLFEPGRICSDTCGFAVCRIVDSFRIGEGETTVVLDASQACHFRWSEPSYLLPRAKPTSSVGQSNVEEVLLCGSTCDESDRIGKFLMRTEDGLFEPGRFVLLGNVAGYSAAWNKGFNGLEASDVRFIG